MRTQLAMQLTSFQTTRLLLVVVLSGLAGCSKTPSMPAQLPAEQIPATVESAFVKAAPEAKQAANTFLSTLHDNDLPGAFTQLQDMAGRTDLTPDQRALTGRAMMTVAQQMQAAAANGDKKAAEFLRMYRGSR